MDAAKRGIKKTLGVVGGDLANAWAYVEANPAEIDEAIRANEMA